MSLWGVKTTSWMLFLRLALVGAVAEGIAELSDDDDSELYPLTVLRLSLLDSA